VHFFRTTDRGLHVIANIRRTDDLFEFGLMNQAGRLLARAAQDQHSIARVKFPGHFLNRK